MRGVLIKSRNCETLIFPSDKRFEILYYPVNRLNRFK